MTKRNILTTLDEGSTHTDTTVLSFHSYKKKQ